MIVLIVADNKTVRSRYVEQFITAGADVLVHDETYGTLADLEHYLYPSLFSVTTPIIHSKFIITSDIDTATPAFIKKLAASPTVFIFEEMMLPAAIITVFKKSGAVVHLDEKQKAVKKAPDLFNSVASIISARDKKSAWIAYRRALETNSIEAIIGIMYWKVRDMATRGEKEKYMILYKKLLSAHARAWQSGTPLELMIEKVLLTQ